MPTEEQLNVQDKKFLTQYGFKPSALCNVFYTPRMLTGVIIDALRQFYADEALIEDKNLRQFVWDSSDNTGILIQEVIDWKPQNTLKRPAILVARGELQKPMDKRSLGNRIHGMEETYSAIFQGTMELYCIGNTGAQVELLATDVYKNLLHFSDFFKNQLRLSTFELNTIGKISLLEESQQHFCVPITVNFAYMENWTIRPDRIPIREININAYIKN